MTRYIAFLRAINIGHGRSLTMETLRKAFQPLEFSTVETFLGSGNVVLEARDRSPRALKEKIEERLLKSLKFDVEVFLRTETELAQIAVYQPFPSALANSEEEVNVVLLNAGLEPLLAQAVAALSTETDEFIVHEREIYWLRRRPPGSPPYSTVTLERTLPDIPFTVRNMRTIKRLAEKYSEAYRSLFHLA